MSTPALIKVSEALFKAATFSFDMISKSRLEEVRKTFNDRFIKQVPGGSGTGAYVATYGGMVFQPWPGYGWYTKPIWYYESHQKYSPKNWQKLAPHTWYRIFRATTETKSIKNPYSKKYHHVYGIKQEIHP